MAQTRILRSAILSSDSIARLSWGAEVFYRRLMSVVDDYGRYDGRASVLRAALYPVQLDKVSEPDVRKWMRETVEAGVVRGYGFETSAEGKLIPIQATGDMGGAGLRRENEPGTKWVVELLKFNQRVMGAAKWPNEHGEYEQPPARKGTGSNGNAQ